MAAPTTPRAAVRLRRPVVDVSFPALGSTVRLIASGPAAQRVVARARADILDYHARLSRFLPGSELSALNRDPRPTVPASALLRDALRAALWAASYGDGLVDPCVHDALVAAGYGRSYERPAEVPAPAGPHRAARPDPAARWRAIRVDEAAGTVARPPGLRLDLGGTGKGHVADLVARRLAACGHWVVDCGGDVRVGGARPVQVAHPLGAEPAAELVVADAALATSSVMSRAWLRDDGRPAHHLLDPSTGLPVRTGLLSASAVAPTTLHAETLAKLALLLGPERARPLLGGHGGVLVYEDGSVETVAPRGRTAA